MNCMPNVQAVEAEGAGAGAAQEDPGRDLQYAEPVVDAARARKDEELERVRRASDRKLRELAQQAQMEGVFIL